MKTILILALVMVWVPGANAVTVKEARLEADGLTCSLCNLSIHRALERLDFVDSVEAVVEQAAFHLSFRSGSAISLDRIREAVRGAGFAVGSLEVRLEGVTGTDGTGHIHRQGDGSAFVLEGRPSGETSGWARVMSSGFLSARDHRAWAAGRTDECVRTGRAAACCGAIPTGTRVYHLVWRA